MLEVGEEVVDADVEDGCLRGKVAGRESVSVMIVGL